MAKRYGTTGNGEQFEVTEEIVAEYVLQISNIIDNWTRDGKYSLDRVCRDGSWITIWFEDDEGNFTSRTIGEGDFALPNDVIEEIIEKVDAVA